MKKINNLYNDIIDIRKIQFMYDRRIRLNTKNKQKLEIFENNYVSNIKYIKDILEAKAYKPGKYNIFIIKEPKVRLIMSQNIIDKVVNHVVSEYFLVNVFDKTLIETNIATRKNRGTHYGLKLIKKYLNEIKDKEFYVLKFDISKYFFNLDHDIIKELLKKKIKDKDVLKILNDVVDTTDCEYVNKGIKKIKEAEIGKIRNSNSLNKEKHIKDIEALPYYYKGRGLPIGNMSSQIIAIMYLNELDHYIKEQLKIKYYVRYMDDGILIHESKEYLKYCLKEIIKILDRYKLKLNSKTKIYSYKEGFEFLGFRFILKNNKIIMKVSNKTKKRFKRKIKNMLKLLDENKITLEEFNHVKSSYLGHLHYGSTNNLIKNNIKDKEKYISVEEVKIIDSNIVKKSIKIQF